MSDYFKWKELDKIEDDIKPFGPAQIRDELKFETDNWTKEKGVFVYSFEEEQRLAVKYLIKHGYFVDYNITDSKFSPTKENYNVFFSKTDFTDDFDYDKASFLKEDKEEYFVGSVAIAGTPEEAQKEFEELGYKVRVEKSAIDHFDTYYLVDIYGSKEELTRLANDPVENGLFTEDEIKSTLEEGKKKKKSIYKGMGMWQWPNPEKGIEMFNHALGADQVAQADGSVGAVGLAEASSAEKKAFKDGGKDLDDLIQGKAIARIKDPKSREAAIASKKAGRDDVVKSFTGDRKEDQAERSWEKKASKMQKAGLKEDLEFPNLQAQLDEFNAPIEWEFEGEKEVEDSPFHFEYRIEDDSLKIYDKNEEFSIDYGEEFDFKPRDRKLEKIREALKKDGFGDEVLEWENNVIMTIHIPEKILKEEYLENNYKYEESIDLSKKESYNITEGGTVMDENKLNEEKSPVVIDGLNITKLVNDEFENHSWLMKKLGE